MLIRFRSLEKLWAVRKQKGRRTISPERDDAHWTPYALSTEL